MNPSRVRKDRLFSAIATMGKGFSSPRRLELLDLLAQGPRTVEQLARASEQPTANTSQHLQALHAAGLVTRRREGTRVRYALAGDDVLALWLALRDASAARLAEVERAAREYLGGDVEALSREELVDRLGRGEVVLIDVRPADEFAAGHIDGAHSIPLDELERRLAELPADREVVAYCRGPFCAYAHEAVRVLRAAGRDARRLADGWPEWKLGSTSSRAQRSVTPADAAASVRAASASASSDPADVRAAEQHAERSKRRYQHGAEDRLERRPGQQPGERTRAERHRDGGHRREQD